jgi:hypothetical protein
MRKTRQEIQAEERAAAEARQVAKQNDVADSARYPIETNLSEFARALERRGRVATLPTIAGWTPLQRHTAAMWIEGALEDIPDHVAALTLYRHPRALLPDERPTPPAPSAVPLPGEPQPTAAPAVRKTRAEAARDTSPAPPPLSPPTARVDVVPGQFVTAHWGEEKYTPVPYQTVSVGPFSATVSVAPGETAEEALGRANAMCVRFAEAARTAKIRSFLDAVPVPKGSGGAGVRS